LVAVEALLAAALFPLGRTSTAALEGPRQSG
jgi:hypothetical protein